MVLLQIKVIKHLPTHLHHKRLHRTILETSTNTWKLAISERVIENMVEKRENTFYEQSFLKSHCFQKSSSCEIREDASVCGKGFTSLTPPYNCTKNDINRSSVFCCRVRKQNNLFKHDFFSSINFALYC